MQWDHSPCPHPSCASRWWDGAGPTWHLVSLASSLYFSLGSVNTSWLTMCLAEAGGSSSWARATCGVVEWFRLCPSRAEGHSVSLRFLVCTVGLGWAVTQSGAQLALWAFLPPLPCAALRTLVKRDVDFSLSARQEHQAPPLHCGAFEPKAHGFGVRKPSSESLLCSQPAMWPWAHHLTSVPSCSLPELKAVVN